MYVQYVSSDLLDVVFQIRNRKNINNTLNKCMIKVMLTQF